jgi:uncharacterized protein YxjI
MHRLTETEALAVRQKKELLEVFSGFETNNNYVVTHPSQGELYLAAEQSSFFLRWILGPLRPFVLLLVDLAGQEVMRVVRSFRFYFHQIEVLAPGGAPLGSVRRRFTLLRRRYDVLDPTGNVLFELFGPLLRPWTFEIRQGGQSRGKISKKWSGLVKEAFTDADNFGIDFPPQAPAAHKALLLGAVFLIDFVHFEKKSD